MSLFNGVREPVYKVCTFCRARQPKDHTEECRQAWRDFILSYGVDNDAKLAA